MSRKTPVLLRKAPMSGRIECLTNYRRITKNSKPLIEVIGGGKHDVTNDWRALMLEDLFLSPDECATVTRALDGGAQGIELDDEERQALADFRERLVIHLDAHNAWLDAGQPYGSESH